MAFVNRQRFTTFSGEGREIAPYCEIAIGGVASVCFIEIIIYMQCYNNYENDI